MQNNPAEDLRARTQENSDVNPSKDAPPATGGHSQPSPAETGLFVEGRWFQTDSRFPVVDKFSGETIAEVASAGAEDVARAVAFCHAAFSDGVPPPHRRADILHRAATLVEQDRGAFEAGIVAESGFTRSDAAGEVNRCIQTLTVSAEEARRFEEGEVVPLGGAPGHDGRLAFTLRVPIGVVAAITPFNSPLNTVAHKVAPAFAAGNPVVLKPAAYTPLTAARLCQVMLDAGMPSGFLALIQGAGSKVGAAILAQPDVRFFTFTGSTEVGLRIQQVAGLRRTQLELGSIAFTILMGDADLDRSLPLIVGACFRKAGQVCTSIQTLLVQDAVADEVKDRMSELARQAKFGDPRDADTLVGPMISSDAAARATAWTNEAIDAGARLLAGGDAAGAKMPPTVLTDVPSGARVLTEEVFAPVVSVVPFTSVDEAIASVNATPYGLATGVFTRDIGHALAMARGLQVGGVHINNTCSSRVDLMPYGGVKDSGFGKEGPRYAMREMSDERLITITP